MPTKEGKVIKVSKEDKEHIERLMAEYGKGWGETVHMALEAFEIDYKAESELMDKAVEKGLVQRCRANRISTHDFFRGIMEMWERGKIEIEGGRVKGVGEWRMKEFETVCYKRGKYPQEVIDMVVAGLKQ
jgi:hypothetical protein